MTSRTIQPEPILSVVIPTKNRAATLSVVVEQLLSWPDQSFELVVEDNSNEESLCAPILARHAHDPRLRWHWDSAARSAIENCDAAVSRASGSVVCFIGDDDAVARQALIAAQWMLDHDVEALVIPPGSYIWPDVRNAVRVNDKYNGRMAPLKASGELRGIDVSVELSSVARAGALTMAHLPRLYHGLVRRDVLARMQAKLGTHFPGPVPDMSNAVGLAAFCKRVWYADMPLVLSGQSASSMSGRNARRDHQGSIRAEASLPANTLQNWDRRIPQYWSGPTIWSQAALQAAKTVGHDQFVARFAFACVYAACLSYNRKQFRKDVVVAIHQHPARRRLGMYAAVAVEMVRIAIKRAKVLAPKLLRVGQGSRHEDVASAVREVERFINANGLTSAFQGRGHVQ